MPQLEGPISVREEELPELYALLNHVFRAQREGDMAREYPRHVGLCNRENIRVIKQDEKIVSHVATSIRPILLNGIPTAAAGIGAVATHESARGQGLASILMKDAVERSVQQGADLMLISGDENIYLRMHATYCCRFPEVRITSEHCSGDFPINLIPANESHLDDIINLRQSLPTRYLLPREDLAALMECRQAMDRPVDWWMVQLSGYSVGWAVTYQKEDKIQLIDWAGSPEILPEAAGLLLNQFSSSSLHYTVPQFSFLPMQWRYLVKNVKPFEGTVLVIGAGRLLQRAEPYFIERLGEEAWESLEIVAEEQRVEFVSKNESAAFGNGGELAQLFFGHPEENILTEKLPQQSELRLILQKLFPIPLVWYGIGYV